MAVLGVTTAVAQEKPAVPAAATEEGTWQFRGNPGLTGTVADALALPLDPLWVFDGAEGFEATAAISGGTVFAGSLEGILYALSLQDGSVRWSYEATAEIKSSPTVYRGLVLFGDGDGMFHAVDATSGKARWTFATGAEILSSANYSGDRIFFGSHDQFIYALNVKDGSLAWKFETDGYVYGTPALFDDKLVSAGCDGFLRVLAQSDGSVLHQIELGGYVGASPAVSNGTVYVGTFENQVHAVDLAGKKVLWTYENPDRKFPYLSSAALTDKLVIVGGRDKQVHALDRMTGEQKWSYSSRGKIDSSPVIAGRRVWVGSAKRGRAGPRPGNREGCVEVRDRLVDHRDAGAGRRPAGHRHAGRRAVLLRSAHATRRGRQRMSTSHEPATAVDVGAQTTDVGSVFVSNYPPYSFWSADHALRAARGALAEAPRPDTPLGLYLHIPFCRKRCKFCYFRVYTDKNAAEVQRYVDAVVREARPATPSAVIGGRSPRFIYFGGGTPSFISSRHLRQVVEALKSRLPWSGVEEVTFECEPGTLTEPKLATIRELGITRLSLGVENWNDEILAGNGRAHVSKEIYRVEPWIRALNFDQLNIDLIAGMVGETWDTWRGLGGQDDRPGAGQRDHLPDGAALQHGLLEARPCSTARGAGRRLGDQARLARLRLRAAVEQAGYEVSRAPTPWCSGDKAEVRLPQFGLAGLPTCSRSGVSSFGHLNGVHYQNTAATGTPISSASRVGSCRSIGRSCTTSGTADPGGDPAAEARVGWMPLLREQVRRRHPRAVRRAGVGRLA